MSQPAETSRHHPFVDACRTAIGAAHVLTDPHDTAPYVTDWRRRYTGATLAVLCPSSAEEVAALVRLAVEHRIVIVPQGGNTGLAGGATPDSSGKQAVLSLKRLNRIRDIDPHNNTITVEAGVVLAEVQARAQEAGRLFPLSLAAEGSCTIGGNLATNAGGTGVLRYGNTRELCLGLEVVTAQGELWDGLRGLRKDNTGYDLRDLFIGSEGTLGVITGATLKLYPQPAAVTTALATTATLSAAVELLQLAQAHLGPALTGFEAMNELALALVAQQFPALRQPLAAAPWTVLIEQSDAENAEHARARFEALLEAALARGCITDAAVAASLEQSKAMWHLRESIPLAQSLAGANIKHDIALPASAVAEFVATTDAALQAAFPGVRLVDFGHLGDGNLHYNVQAPDGMAPPDFLGAFESKVNALVYDAVTARGGSISAEHGIGEQKRDALAQRKSPVALQLMRAIKRALDPENLLNPGRVLKP